MAGYIGTQAVSVNTTSATISDDLAVGDDLTVTDDATIGGTALVTGVLTTTAKAVSNGGIGMPDDAKLTFGGTGTGDLQIFHDGSNSYITDAGTGDLIIRGSNNIRLQSNSGETYLIGELDGPVYLRHNDVNKLATSATGVTVTGEMAATTMDLSSNAVIDGTALVTGVLTTTAATVSNGGGQFNGAINVGVDDTGYDVKFFGATASAFMQWDASTDDLLLGGASRLGIGTASPSSPLEVSNGTENQRIDFASGVVYLMARNASAYITQEYIANIHKFTGHGNNSSNESMQISAAGALLFGTTTSLNSGYMTIGKTSGGAVNGLTICSPSTNVACSQLLFQNPNGAVGSVTTSGSATAYNTSSDYRLKENVDYDWDATTRLKQLKPARFNFIADADNTVDGFLAHEAATVVPEAVVGTHNETQTLTKVVLSSSNTVLAENIEQSDWAAGKSATTDADGNAVAAIYASDSTWAAEHVVPKMQGIDQAKIVPLLVKTILELEARITALEG